VAFEARMAKLKAAAQATYDEKTRLWNEAKSGASTATTETKVKITSNKTTAIPKRRPRLPLLLRPAESHINMVPSAALELGCVCILSLARQFC